MSFVDESRMTFLGTKTNLTTACPIDIIFIKDDVVVAGHGNIETEGNIKLEDIQAVSDIIFDYDRVKRLHTYKYGLCTV